MCALHARRTQDALKLEPWVVVSYHVSAGIEPLPEQYLP